LVFLRMNQVIRWANNDILINNTVRIVDPYRAENVSIDPPTQPTNPATLKTSAKGDNDTKTHIIKLVNLKNKQFEKENLFFLGGQILVGSNKSTFKYRFNNANKIRQFE
jgi:hypothetical protein